MSDTKSVKPGKFETSFEPSTVCEHFKKITKLPHPSGSENPLREYIVSFAKGLGLTPDFYKEEATDPGIRVIVIRRKGSGKYADHPFVTLQAHTDMVCDPNNDIFELDVFDYLDANDGERWIKAGSKDSIDHPELGTTLGADDGIGVATILAILEDETFKDYPLECFFTVQEETDMGGATNFDPNILVGTKYINLDAEVLKTIIYGSAGGCHAQFTGKIERAGLSPEKYAILKVVLSGLLSGHSGVNINNGRLNAIKALSDVLCRLNKRLNCLDIKGNGIQSYDFLLISIKRDEDPKMNKIPGRAYAEIALPLEQVEGFIRDCKAYCENIKEENQPEEKLVYEVIRKDGYANAALDESSTDSILSLLKLIPHGPIKMIPTNPTLVETSTNLADIEIVNSKVVIQSSNRSSNDVSMKFLRLMQETAGNIFGFEVSFDNSYPSWQPDEGSKLLAMAKEVYAHKYGEDVYSATVIHAGLECSYIVEKFGKAMECISIGPTIVNPHTGGERLQASSVKSFYEAVGKLLDRVFQ